MKISQVQTDYQNGSKKNNKSTRNFNGGVSDTAFNALNKTFSLLDKNAMIQVSFVDTVSTNIPRTIVDLKTSLAASLETFRREFSGLFVNCLMPGLVVSAIAHILPKSDELKGTNAANSWANSDAIDKFKTIYVNTHSKGVKNPQKEFVKQSLCSISALDGVNWIDYASKQNDAKFISAADDITLAINKDGKERTKLLKSAREKLSSLTKAESMLNFNGKPTADLEHTLRDIADLGSKFNKVKEKCAKKSGKKISELSHSELSNEIEKYSNSLKSFVNKKSLIGMGIVLGIAVSMQTINRAITRKQFKSEGAPIYKDFGKKDTTKKMNEKQKKEFWGKKILYAAGMYALAALSMMKKPTVKMFQFSNIFPTLDQCRWIAASTFASRMVVSEDENELRETTIRDLASFAGLYFLGDYVKKGSASIIEFIAQTKQGKQFFGEDIILLNRKKTNENAKLTQKIQNWIKNTELKYASEVSSIKVRNLRNLCRVADLAFSIVMLGVILPVYNRKVTDRKVQEAQQRELELQKLSGCSSGKNNYPSIFKDMV